MFKKLLHRDLGLGQPEAATSQLHTPSGSRGRVPGMGTGPSHRPDPPHPAPPPFLCPSLSLAVILLLWSLR